ncbi:MAG: ImmA/IrrE family metallo-endopeptidase [Candidatus Gracilibacteria bacterium]
MKPNYQNAVDKALAIIEDNYVCTPPIDIVEIAKNYGLSLVEIEFIGEHASVAGFIDPSSKTMYISKSDPDHRKAFTIAHELGHWILHQPELGDEPHKYAILYRKPLGASTTDPLEKEANAFAANLLVPRKFLDTYKDLDVASIAKIFGVSPEVIGYRLQIEYGR